MEKDLKYNVRNDMIMIGCVVYLQMWLLIYFWSKFEP